MYFRLQLARWIRESFCVGALCYFAKRKHSAAFGPLVPMPATDRTGLRPNEARRLGEPLDGDRPEQICGGRR